MEQEKVMKSALFVTLTYDTRFVPITKRGYMTLDKTDVQKFMKRLRKLSGEKIKYFAVGEYGSKTERPHYHLILFNATEASIMAAWCLDGKPLGSVHFGQVTGASIGYTLKYMAKNCKIPKHANDDRNKGFALMSKGLGANYLNAESMTWHLSAEGRMYVNLLDGKKASMPRYYKDRIYTKTERQVEGLLAQKQREKKEALERAKNPNYDQEKIAAHIHSFKLLANVKNSKI